MQYPDSSDSRSIAIWTRPTLFPALHMSFQRSTDSNNAGCVLSVRCQEVFGLSLLPSCLSSDVALFQRPSCIYAYKFLPVSWTINVCLSVCPPMCPWSKFSSLFISEPQKGSKLSYIVHECSLWLRSPSSFGYCFAEDQHCSL